ncbi:hypothetical protein PSPO01_00538 [Paraphaeosphaeria sporulosa]
MPQLTAWWKCVRIEHTCYYKKIVELKAKIRKADREIGPAKRREGPRATVTKRLIQHRRSCHEKVKPLEAHLYMLKRQLVSFDKTFDSAIQPYSRISSLSLTATLYTKCPRELRDLVYYYLLNEHTTTDDPTVLQIQRYYEAPIDSKPIFLDSGYVHGEVLSEIRYTVEKKAAQKLHSRS